MNKLHISDDARQDIIDIIDLVKEIRREKREDYYCE